MRSSIYITILFTFSLFTCGNNSSNIVSQNSNSASLDPIWFEGNAEISSFELQQNRYNSIHKGEAVLIFVTEPFLTDKQVKNDSGKSKNSVSILKNNQIRRFTTGIYDYSIFTSIFTDPENLNTYKVSNSSQDWCGQTFSQINKSDQGYQFQLHSYFEFEGDQKVDIEQAVLEDELYNLIRINEKNLPIGAFKIILASHTARLLHKSMNPVDAIGTLETYKGTDMEGQSLKAYKVVMPSLQRELEIIYDAQSKTNEIVGWKDSSPSVFDNTVRTTIAKRKNIIWSPYWNLNHANDIADRKKLLLKDF